MNYNKIKKAFTLAEVLIVLGIIGVIAEMTIPTLISGVQNQTTVTSLKKAYSIMSQAYTMAVQENGRPDTWGLTADFAGSVALLKNIAPQLRTSKICEGTPGCFPTGYYKYPSGANNLEIDPSTAYGKLSLNDGTLLLFESFGTNCDLKKGNTNALQHVCGGIYVDINGFKKPNQYGVDWFNFLVTTDGIVPSGGPDQTIGSSFENSCQNKATAGGFACTAWVIYNENLDYMKPDCTDLSWNGKLKCN